MVLRLLWGQVKVAARSVQTWATLLMHSHCILFIRVHYLNYFKLHSVMVSGTLMMFSLHNYPVPAEKKVSLHHSRSPPKSPFSLNGPSHPIPGLLSPWQWPVFSLSLWSVFCAHFGCMILCSMWFPVSGFLHLRCFQGRKGPVIWRVTERAVWGHRPAAVKAGGEGMDKCDMFKDQCSSSAPCL